MKKACLVLCALALAPAALALEVGDPAPPVKVDLWLNGEPVNPAEPDGETVYVVEFWATWCPPCRKSIPHLNALQAKWKDRNVVVVGITDEPEEKVRPFFEKMEMAYHVAIDTNRTTVDAYMKGIPGIPHAFIVDAAGKVVWSGHPLSGLDETLEQVLAGTYDMEKASDMQKAEEDLQALVMEGDYEKAAAQVEELLEKGGPKMEYFQVLLGLLAQTGRTDRYPEVYRRIQSSFAEDADALNTLAWIACTSPFPLCDLQIALEAGRTSVALSERKNASYLDTLARVHYALGMLEAAVATQEEAVNAAAGNEEEQADFQETLEYYRTALELRVKIGAESAAGAAP